MVQNIVCALAIYIFKKGFDDGKYGAGKETTRVGDKHIHRFRSDKEQQTRSDSKRTRPLNLRQETDFFMEQNYVTEGHEKLL